MSPTKGFYHCFGCGEHGTAIGFLMNYDNLRFPDAVEALAEMLGMEVPREAGHPRTARARTTSFSRCCAKPIRSIASALRDDPEPSPT